MTEVKQKLTFLLKIRCAQQKKIELINMPKEKHKFGLNIPEDKIREQAKLGKRKGGRKIKKVLFVCEHNLCVR